MLGASAVSRVQAALDAANGTQNTLNAFISIDDERALERASEIDARISKGEHVGPLAGVPVGLKDLIDQRGRVTTAGSAFYRQEPGSNAPCVDALEQAGAVIIGRTGLHEWAFGFSSENPHWGVIRNPWDQTTSPGGSSGGSAVAVAAGITPMIRRHRHGRLSSRSCRFVWGLWAESDAWSDPARWCFPPGRLDRHCRTVG